MKKLLFVMVLGFGAAMFVKNGHVTITQDKQIRVAGYSVPLPDAVQNSPLMGFVTTMLPEASPTAGGSPGAPLRPMLPIVTSGTSTYNANASGSANMSSRGQATGAEGLNAAAKALRGSQ